MPATTLDYLLERSEKRLVGVNATVAAKAIELIKLAYRNGINIAVTQGLRTFAEQNALYEQGRTKPGKIVTNARGGQSIHNYGLAFDIAIFDDNQNAVWTGNDYNRVGKLGQQLLGLEWGGAWRSFKDLPHFQYTFGLTLSQLQAGRKPPSGGAVAPSQPLPKNYLERGDSGTLVKGLQGKLQAVGFSVGSGGVDGDYGVGTEQAVKAFQKKYGLTADGIAGALTLAKLDEVYKASQKPKPTPAPTPAPKPTTPPAQDPAKEEPKVDKSKLPADPAAREEVNEAIERGITNGARPQDEAKRQDAMVMAKRAGDFQDYQIQNLYTTFQQVKDKLPLQKPEVWEEKLENGDVSQQEMLYLIAQLTLRSFG
ncbi:peptidoglycan-binding protein [Priestia endophytica]|uniref:peptidoglycan-binding protein n=1 Tax=Priestia endophytica TaxID=135735 RepID=UPI00227DDB07|nr:peptidoglycan-binding protein [Priestia endophytica]MCY8232344.1 peptidoglycan-binding protein [Priestia endophytica]